jgi:hypothetical protein
MCDGYNCRQLSFHDEEHTEREAMNNGSPKLTENERKAQRPFLDPCERGAKLGEEFRAKALPFAVVPQCRLEGIMFCFRPNAQPGHLPTGAETLLNPFNNFLPGPGGVRGPAMCGQALL